MSLSICLLQSLKTLLTRSRLMKRPRKHYVNMSHSGMKQGANPGSFLAPDWSLFPPSLFTSLTCLGLGLLTFAVLDLCGYTSISQRRQPWLCSPAACQLKSSRHFLTPLRPISCVAVTTDPIWPFISNSFYWEGGKTLNSYIHNSII